jgi:hypothetical protein
VGALIDISVAVKVSFVDPIVKAGGLAYGLAGYLVIAIFFSSRVG